jgi:uncharacterized protein
MRYNVAQLLKEPIGSTRNYRLDESLTGPDPFADWVSGTVRLLKTHQGILASADLAVTARVTCGRCLTEHAVSLDLSIEEEFYPVVEIQTGRRLSAPPGSEGARIDANHTLEISEMLRQYIITDSPMKPLCSPQCLGLCQGCGVNLNELECQCGRPAVDPRWGRLAGLLDSAN